MSASQPGSHFSQFVNRSAQDHLLYIQEKVNPILEALVTAVLLERPEDPAFFMLKWLCEQTKSLDGQDRAGSTAGEELESVRAEIKRLKERKTELEALASSCCKEDVVSPRLDGKSDKSTKADENSEEDDEDDDDTVEVMPEPPKGMNRGPRQSVSAEAYGDWNKKSDFVPPVYEKTPEQKARIAKCLEPSFLFSALEPQEMETITLAFKEKVVDEGVRLIQQGDDGECMFLIEEGSVDCLIKKADADEKVVKTCGAGDVFGELALLYNCPRAASVQTTQRTTLWELDRQTFNCIVKDAAAKKRTTYTDFLKKVPLFGNMDQYEIMTIADALKVDIYQEAGVQIIQQGEAGDKFFIVLEGECEAKKAFVSGQEPQKVMTHKAGDYFGELALLKGELRAASVFTSAPSKVLWMDRKTFKRLCGPIQDILRREAKRYEMPASSTD